MKKCLKCGALLDDDAVFCAECGTNELIRIENEKPAVDKKRCPVCGEALEDDSRFCTNCGARLEQEPKKPEKPKKPAKEKKPRVKKERNINKKALKGVISAVISVILAAAIGVGGYFIGKVSSPSNNKEINEALCSGRWIAMDDETSGEGFDPYFDFVVFHKDGMCSFFTSYAGYRVVNDAVVLSMPNMYEPDELEGGKPTYYEYILKFNEDKSVLTLYGTIGKEYNGDNIRYFLGENANGKDFRERKIQYYDTFDECYNALMESVNESKIDDEYRLVRF